MKKSIKVAHKKRRGRPATGKAPHMAARMPPELIAEVDAWATANDTSRSDAFRRLVELGLKVKPKG
jgi:Ribbon-helix-helix protein, copG family